MILYEFELSAEKQLLASINEEGYKNEAYGTGIDFITTLDGFSYLKADESGPEISMIRLQAQFDYYSGFDYKEKYTVSVFFKAEQESGYTKVRILSCAGYNVWQKETGGLYIEYSSDGDVFEELPVDLSPEIMMTMGDFNCITVSVNEIDKKTIFYFNGLKVITWGEAKTTSSSLHNAVYLGNRTDGLTSGDQAINAIDANYGDQARYANVGFSGLIFLDEYLETEDEVYSKIISRQVSRYPTEFGFLKKGGTRKMNLFYEKNNQWINLSENPDDYQTLIKNLNGYVGGEETIKMKITNGISNIKNVMLRFKSVELITDEIGLVTGEEETIFTRSYSNERYIENPNNSNLRIKVEGLYPDSNGIIQIADQLNDLEDEELPGTYPNLEKEFILVVETTGNQTELFEAIEDLVVFEFIFSEEETEENENPNNESLPLDFNQ